MISIDVFLIGLSIISVATGLVTEAVKKILTEMKVTYQSNLISGIIAIVLSVAVGVCYIIFANVGFSAQSIICVVILAFASWLCSMVGYDKVVQFIDQFKKK